jgi:drug/metabolite transporter (DMT)-like permease
MEKTVPAPNRTRATGLSSLSWVMFASSGSLAAAVMAAGWSPAAVTSVRLASAAALLVPMVAVLRPGAVRFGRADLWLLPGYGLLGVGGVQLLFFVAVARIPVGVAMVLVNLAPALFAAAAVLALLEPVVAAALAWMLLGQALGPMELAGAAIVLTGAVLVQLGRPGTTSAR